MKSFKTYVLTEAARAKHALRFFDYEHNEHSDIAKKIRADLEKAWMKIAEKYEPADTIDSDSTEDSKYFDEVEFTNKEANVGRFGNKSAVYPSVKVGGAYEKSIRNECKKELMSEAHKVLDRYKTKLNQDVPNNPFMVSQEDGPLGEIRLKFKTGEYIKTLFMVAVEPGYKFERVYLKDYLEK
jgi:hypothetical protein